MVNVFINIFPVAIKTTQDLIPEGTYMIKLQVIDDCELSSTSTVTLTVQNTVSMSISLISTVTLTVQNTVRMSTFPSINGNTDCTEYG